MNEHEYHRTDDELIHCIIKKNDFDEAISEIKVLHKIAKCLI